MLLAQVLPSTLLVQRAVHLLAKSTSKFRENIEELQQATADTGMQKHQQIACRDGRNPWIAWLISQRFRNPHYAPDVGSKFQSPKTEELTKGAKTLRIMSDVGEDLHQYIRGQVLQQPLPWGESKAIAQHAARCSWRILVSELHFTLYESSEESTRTACLLTNGWGRLSIKWLLKYIEGID